MTNADKYKTAQERAEGFSRYCNSFNECQGCEIKCRGAYDTKRYYVWLELKAEDEKPLPCPFCGGEVSPRVYWNDKCYYKCVSENCLYSSALRSRDEEAIDAHNRVAKAVAKSEVTK